MQLTIDARPTKVEDVFGQPAIVKELAIRIKNRNFPTASLFRGQTGTGKSTCSKLLAMAIVCSNPLKDNQPCGQCMHCKDIINENYSLDVSMLDGSTEGGKQAVIDFGKQSKLSPMYSRASVYIIEEVDQLSASAKSSLLKVLENPNDNVHFMMLSMEETGLKKELLDRCQIFRFKPFNTMDVMLGLKNVLERLNLWGSDTIPKEFFSEGLRSIAEASEGSLRAGVRMLDKCLSGEFYTKDDMKMYLNIMDVSTVNDFLMEATYLKRNAFYTLDTLEISSVLSLGYNNLSDALRYIITGEAKYDHYESQTKALSEAPFLQEVITVFEEVMSTPIFNKMSLLTSKLSKLYLDKKKRV